MSFLENIKLIASELSSMSPRTQLEIVKLCKDLCIETKNYLVELDETTLGLMDAKIQALETATSNLQTLYTNIADELQTAEGNITANANAIELLQGSVEAITEALSGIYTKSQVDTLLSAKADKLDTYTKTEVNTLLNDKADKSTTYTKTEVNTALSDKASLSSNNTFTGTNTFNNDVSFGNGAQVAIEDFDNVVNESANKTLLDYLNEKQDALTAGSGITIQNNVISASGATQHLYLHNITIYSGYSLIITTKIFTTNNTPFTVANLITWLNNNGFTSNRNLYEANGRTGSYEGSIVVGIYEEYNDMNVAYVPLTEVSSGTYIIDNYEGASEGYTNINDVVIQLL